MARSKRRSDEGSLSELIRTVIYALLLALVIRVLFFQPFNIPSGSMKPTLLVGDYLFVSKYSYGYSRYSIPFSPPLFEGRLWGGMPKRGDVAVFRHPLEPGTDYIKRIVGLPGDRIQVRDGVLYINDEPVRRRVLGTDADTNGYGIGAQVTIIEETLPNGRSYLTFDQQRPTSVDNTTVFVVPEGHFFAMGDNRDNSQDSRSPRVGPVPIENLIGRAEIIFFSLEDGTSFWQIWKWPWSLRFDRFFDGVD